jgi:flagellar FliL protein
MSTATVEAVAPPPPKFGGKKKLIVIVAAALLVVLAGGGAALFLMKKKASAADEEGDEPVAEAKAEQAEPSRREERKPPIFVPLDPFTVNLADRDAERYAQIGVTLEIDDPKVGEELKTFMPAIRNNILMLLAHKTAGELLTREGKLKLMREIRRETMTPLGYHLDVDAGDSAQVAGRKKKKQAEVVYPVKAVHFANIIIQ